VRNGWESTDPLTGQRLPTFATANAVQWPKHPKSLSPKSLLFRYGAAAMAAAPFEPLPVPVDTVSTEVSVPEFMV